MDSGKKILSFEEFVTQGMPQTVAQAPGAEPMSFGMPMGEPTGPHGHMGHGEMPVPAQLPMGGDSSMDLPMMDEPEMTGAEAPEMPHEDEPEAAAEESGEEQ